MIIVIMKSFKVPLQIIVVNPLVFVMEKVLIQIFIVEVSIYYLPLKIL